jgi:hypothetical protein
MTYVSSAAQPTSLSDRYLVLLGGVLAGYALMGKGFAYLGVPPIYVGEVAFLAGIAVFLRSGCLIASLTTLPSLLLAAMMIWVLLRTLPFVNEYGLEALRDSVLIIYGGFAFIVVALLLEDSRRLNAIIRYYAAFLGVFVPVIPFLFAFSRYMQDSIPHVPGTTVQLVLIGSGEVPVHLAGAVVFVLAGFRRATPLWIGLIVVALLMVSANTRGGTLAFVVPVAVAALMLGKVRELATVLVAGLLILAAAYSIESTFTGDREEGTTVERQLSTRQIVANVESILGHSDRTLESSKTWRLQWWDTILKDTVFGAHFWTGRGFGLNLADADGFASDRKAGERLRSPHNVHMTILARAGVPGLALWIVFLTSWLGMIANAVLTARRRRHGEWSGLFLFIGCYAMSCVINATFDVALEGPVQGIWFWCLIGFGIGSVMIYRYQMDFPSQEQVVRAQVVR